MWSNSNSAGNDRTGVACERLSEPRWWTVWKWIERVLFTCGLGLLAIYGAVRFESWHSSQAALKSFSALETPVTSAKKSYEGDNSVSLPDFGAWDENRVRAYNESLSKQPGVPLGVLQIPKIHLVVPLLDGTDDLTLNHAVGRIAGTARPGVQGNIGIAGHRDGFFRGLKDIKLGDAIELRTVQGTDKYVVDQIRIVNPDNVSVLMPRASPSLTLVTCYPFYFIGSAPQRYVVMASLERETSNGPGSSIPGPQPQSTTNIKETK